METYGLETSWEAYKGMAGRRSQENKSAIKWRAIIQNGCKWKEIVMVA